MIRPRTVALVGLAAFALGCRGGPPPNVVLIVIDTLRADRVSSYGYSKPTTPHIDALARRGVRFDDAQSTSSWTLPAHASIFTGLYPIEHGATQEHTQLDARAPTLAERFAAADYVTLGVSSNGVINANSGLTRGFSRFVEAWRARPPRGHWEPPQHPNVVAIRQFLREVGPEQRFFAFVNFVEVHGPYTPPANHQARFVSPAIPRSRIAATTRRNAAAYYLDKHSFSREDFELLGDLYDGEVNYVDTLVDALVGEIERAGRLDDTLLVITSDHGENLGEHGHYRHIFSLYEDTVRVPLIVLLPGGDRAGEVRSEPVSLVDLFPTLLEAAGIAVDASVRGRNILDRRIRDEPLFAEYYFPLQALNLFDAKTRERYRDRLEPYLRRLRSVQSDGWRLIWSSDGTRELYHVASDPQENENLVGSPEAAGQADRLGALVDRFVESAGGNQPLPDEAAALVGAFSELDADTERQLRELGYLPEAAPND